jgi:hypothetical protein
VPDDRRLGIAGVGVVPDHDIQEPQRTVDGALHLRAQLHDLHVHIGVAAVAGLGIGRDGYGAATELISSPGTSELPSEK